MGGGAGCYHAAKSRGSRFFRCEHPTRKLDLWALAWLARAIVTMSNILQEMAESIQGRIRQVAYIMWESAGRQHGMAMDYWLAAEREVLTTMQSAAERLMPSEAKADQAAPSAATALPPPAAAVPAAKAVEEAAPAKPAGRKAPAAKAKTKSS